MPVRRVDLDHALRRPRSWACAAPASAEADERDPERDPSTRPSMTGNYRAFDSRDAISYPSTTIGSRSLTNPGVASTRSSQAATREYSRGSASASAAQWTYPYRAMSATV